MIPEADDWMFGHVLIHNSAPGLEGWRVSVHGLTLRGMDGTVVHSAGSVLRLYPGRLLLYISFTPNAIVLVFLLSLFSSLPHLSTHIRFQFFFFSSYTFPLRVYFFYLFFLLPKKDGHLFPFPGILGGMVTVVRREP